MFERIKKFFGIDTPKTTSIADQFAAAEQARSAAGTPNFPPSRPAESFSVRPSVNQNARRYGSKSTPVKHKIMTNPPRLAARTTPYNDSRDYGISASPYAYNDLSNPLNPLSPLYIGNDYSAPAYSAPAAECAPSQSSDSYDSGSSSSYDSGSSSSDSGACDSGGGGGD